MLTTSKIILPFKAHELMYSQKEPCNCYNTSNLVFTCMERSTETNCKQILLDLLLIISAKY